MIVLIQLVVAAGASVEEEKEGIIGKEEKR